MQYAFWEYVQEFQMKPSTEKLVFGQDAYEEQMDHLKDTREYFMRCYKKYVDHCKMWDFKVDLESFTADQSKLILNTIV
jgi:hypothetical protein